MNNVPFWYTLLEVWLHCGLRLKATVKSSLQNRVSKTDVFTVFTCFQQFSVTSWRIKIKAPLAWLFWSKLTGNSAVFRVFSGKYRARAGPEFSKGVKRRENSQNPVSPRNHWQCQSANSEKSLPSFPRFSAVFSKTVKTSRQSGDVYTCAAANSW